MNQEDLDKKHRNKYVVFPLTFIGVVLMILGASFILRLITISLAPSNGFSAEAKTATAIVRGGEMTLSEIVRVKDLLNGFMSVDFQKALRKEGFTDQEMADLIKGDVPVRITPRKRE